MNNPKADGYRAKPINEDDVVNAIETEPADLTPDPETVVATGDEETPMPSTVHEKGLKNLYDKAKRNRELVQREDAEGTPDVDKIQRLVAEAAGGKDIDSSAELDTNRPGRFDNEGRNAEEMEAARMIKDAEERVAAEKAGEPEPVSEPNAADALPETDEETIVKVTVLGRNYRVPQQDIDDAGGVKAYQKNRAATIRLGRAATAENAAQAKLREIEEQQLGVQQLDPSPPDGQPEADVESLYNEMMDVVVDGNKDDIKEWIARNKAASTQVTPDPPPAKPADTDGAAKPLPVTETQEELNRQFEVDRLEANAMMYEEFPEIMADDDLKEMAQQRFRVVVTNPDNEGRSQKDMVREAANHVRSIPRKLRQTRPDPIEEELNRRVERKRVLPQASRADSKAPSNEPKASRVPSNREHFQRLRRRAGQDLELK